MVAGMTATGEHEYAAATYARLSQWMLWILLPLATLMNLAGGTILLIFGPAFEQGAAWLGIVAIACATNAFINLGETVVMVQRPGLNLMNSLLTCAVGTGAIIWLIPRWGVIGAALGILLAYLVQGLVRAGLLRFVFRWPNPWPNLRPPLFTLLTAGVPALACRFLWPGIAGQLSAAVIFLLIFGAGYFQFRRSEKLT
jgi:O-antigen/teichoic acid export membrane protein